MPLVSYNGALVKGALSGKVYVNSPLKLQTALDLLQYVKENGHYVQVYMGDKLYVKEENECGAFIAKAVTENGKLILNILKRYNHKIEPAANWEKLLQIQDASKAYEALSVVLKK